MKGDGLHEAGQLRRLNENYHLPFSWANLLASKNVTSRSASKSFLLPTSIITMFGLASVRASVSQFVRALYVSRLEWSKHRKLFIRRLLK